MQTHKKVSEEELEMKTLTLTLTTRHLRLTFRKQCLANQQWPT